MVQTPEIIVATWRAARKSIKGLTEHQVGDELRRFDAMWSELFPVEEETQDPSIIWEGHKVGREIPYCHMEKLCNLEQLPPHGFTVVCFPSKIKGASGGWTRAVALFD